MSKTLSILFASWLSSLNRLFLLADDMFTCALFSPLHPFFLLCNYCTSGCTESCQQTLTWDWLHAFMDAAQPLYHCYVSFYILDKTRPIMCLQGILIAAFIQLSLFPIRYWTRTDGAFLCMVLHQSVFSPLCIGHIYYMCGIFLSIYLSTYSVRQ